MSNHDAYLSGLALREHYALQDAIRDLARELGIQPDDLARALDRTGLTVKRV